MRSILKDPRVGRVRHQHHRQRRTQVRTWFLVLLLFAASAAVTWQFARQQPVASLSGSFASLEPGGVSLGKTPDAKSVPASSAEYLYIASRPSRPAYAYSIVPGGVGSAEELRQIAEHDPVVAQHFQGFDYQHAHLVTVAESNRCTLPTARATRCTGRGRKLRCIRAKLSLATEKLRRALGAAIAWLWPRLVLRRSWIPWRRILISLFSPTTWSRTR